MLPIAERLGTTSGSETVLPTSCPNHPQPECLESMCGPAYSFHVAGQKGPGSGEVGTLSWKASEAPGFEPPGPNYSQQNRG